MPPKRKKRSKSMPKQTQSQRQSVVVNIGTSKTKSKPRKSSGRGGLPPPSYAHNLAPTFITAPQVDYTPILGAIAGLTARLQPEPRIENPVTPLSSMTQVATQNAQQMAGEKAEERRAGRTADNFVDQPSQVRMETPKITFTPKEKRKKQGFKPIIKLGGERKGEMVEINPLVVRPPDESIPKASLQERLSTLGKKSTLDEALEAISMMKKANPAPPSIGATSLGTSLGATSLGTSLGVSSKLASSGESDQEQDLSGFLSAFGSVIPEQKKRRQGRPPGSRNKPK